MFNITERLASTLRTISAVFCREDVRSGAGGVVGGEDGWAPGPRVGPAGGHLTEEDTTSLVPLVGLRSHEAGGPPAHLTGLQFNN